MSQEPSIATLSQIPVQSVDSQWIENSFAIDLGLSQLQAVGDRMAACSEEGVEDGTMVRLGQLIRDKAQEIKALWEEERTFLMRRRLSV
jgi:hypothetical protein